MVSRDGRPADGGRLFEVLKQGFALYVWRTFRPTRWSMGRWAAFPLFLVWAYMSWVVVLLGA